MTTLKQIFNMTEEEKKKYVNTMGVIMLNIAERKSIYQMADEVKLDAYQVNHNIDEMLYTLRKSLGWRRYLKALFMK